MLYPLYMGLLHAVEPDHVAVVTAFSLAGRRKGAWKVGLAFGLSHMLAVALLALLSTWAGRTLFGEGVLTWLDRGAWAFVAVLGLWNLAGALGLRRLSLHDHPHSHGLLQHHHPHAEGHAHGFHHSAAWLGAFFGLGGIRGFSALLEHTGIQGPLRFVGALGLFGLGIVAMFMVLAMASGWIASRFSTTGRWRRILYGISGAGNLAVGLVLLIRG